MEPRSAIVLTFPRAEYQRYLYVSQRNELQPVAEIMSAGTCSCSRKQLGWRFNLSSRPVARVSFVHCVLARGRSLTPVRPSRLGQLAEGAARAARAAVVGPWVRRKYRRALEDIRASQALRTCPSTRAASVEESTSASESTEN